MEPSSPPPKKGLGVLAWLGIGCGGLIVIGIVITVLVTVFFGPRIKQFAADAAKNPTRATASMMVSASADHLEMVAEDDVNKRYTIRDKQSGKLTTIYWDAKKNAPAVVPGDFSAIPAEATAPGDSAPK